jgi:hypothetical protein
MLRNSVLSEKKIKVSAKGVLNDWGWNFTLKYHTHNRVSVRDAAHFPTREVSLA